MRKITTLFAACLIAGTSMAQTDFTWVGGEEQKVWNYSIVNWAEEIMPGMLFPGPFTAGSNAIFNDNVTEGAENLKLDGVVTVGGIKYNGTKDIKISRTNTGNFTTDVLKGDATLIKEGTGTFALAVENELTGGSVVKEGILRMDEAPLAATQYNPFGAKVVLEGGAVDLATAKSKSSDAEYIRTSPIIEIPEGKSGTIMMASYTYFSGSIKGAGDLTIAFEGERGYMQNRPASAGMSDWSEYTGKNIKLEYIENTQNTASLMVLGTNKTFDPDSPTYEGAEVTFADKSITLGAKAGIAMESGTTAWVIGELKADDETARIMGYRSNSNGPRPYWIVGGLNTDVVLKARFVSPASQNYNANCFIKVGTGTYTFTNNNSLIQVVGLRIDEGKILVCDDVLRGNYSGAVGGNVVVNANGILGGTGRIQTHSNNGTVNVYGKLEPGANGYGNRFGTLMISDSLNVNPLSKYEIPFSYKVTDGAATTHTIYNGGTNRQHLNLRPGSVTEIEIMDVNKYDKVNVRGNLRFYTEPDNKPKIQVVIPSSYSINDGDEFEIITAFTCTNADNAEVDDYFDITYPSIEGVTWSSEIKYEDLEAETFDNIMTNIDGTEYPMDAPVTVTGKKYSIVVKASGNGVGIQDNKVSAEEVVTLYPNPTYNDFKVSANDVEINSVEVYGLQGQLVKSQVVSGNEATIGISQIPAGVYLVKVYTTNGVAVQKLVKK